VIYQIPEEYVGVTSNRFSEFEIVNSSAKETCH
jgi:hypothetical protein